MRRHRRRALLDGVDVAKEAIVQGQVTREGEPVGNAYVRLLDRTGEFTAEVPTSATGHFRFFAGDGEWTLRTLAPKSGPVDSPVARRCRLRRRGHSDSPTLRWVVPVYDVGFTSTHFSANNRNARTLTAGSILFRRIHIPL